MPTHEEILETVRQAVRETVNGKIDAIKVDIANIKAQIEDHKTAHAEDMNLIKPVIENFNQWSGFRKGLVSISVIVGSLVGIGMGFGYFVNLFKLK